MTDVKTAPEAPQNGFSTRWMLDRDARPKATVAGDAGASASPIDTDGDGIADTLAVRVDATPPRRSALRAFGTWLTRSIVTVVLVAALVAAAAASAALLQARDDVAATRSQLREERTATQQARTELADANGRIATLQDDATKDAATSKDVTSERDELELEVKVLRHMLVDSETR